MGGWNSGRSGGRPIKEDGLTIDIALMLRKGWMRDGARSWGGRLTWSWSGGSSSTISYNYDLTDPYDASMTLIYRQRRSGEDWQDRKQHIRLVHTVPPFGGRRWWMVCPVRHERVGKLYLPNGGDIFAGRKAWRLGYRSQRVASRDKAFERLFSLQRKLGCHQGWEAGLYRPKGMWNRTFERHFERYLELDAQCAVEMMGVLGRLRGSLRGQ
jgi:hypothetical protein